MGQSQAAAGMDRLPWLADEPAPPPRKLRRAGNRATLGSALAATLLIGAASYWIGTRTGEQQQAPQAGMRHPTMTVALPQPRTTEPQQVQPQQPQVTIERAPVVSPPAAREVPLSAPRARKHSTASAAPSATGGDQASAELDKVVAADKAAPATAKPAASPETKPLTAWPASQSKGAKGRIVRIGAFGSRQQAKLGWRHMVTTYPAVAHLKATVVADRNSRGRRFYRFQIGTTSQAHSEVLCQRMDKIRLSCAVVGLPFDPKGVER